MLQWIYMITRTSHAEIPIPFVQLCSIAEEAGTEKSAKCSLRKLLSAQHTSPGKLKPSPMQGNRLGVLQSQATESMSPATSLIPFLLTVPRVGRNAYSPQQAADVCSSAPLSTLLHKRSHSCSKTSEKLVHVFFEIGSRWQCTDVCGRAGQGGTGPQIELHSMSCVLSLPWHLTGGH